MLTGHGLLASSSTLWLQGPDAFMEQAWFPTSDLQRPNTAGQYSVLQRKGVLTHAATRMDLEGLLLSEATHKKTNPLVKVWVSYISPQSRQIPGDRK